MESRNAERELAADFGNVLPVYCFGCQSLQPVRIHPYFYAIIAANTENKIENTEKIASAACVLAAILYRTKHKIRIYTPKVTD